MLTELLSGLWIGNHEDAHNEEFYKDNLITIAINCTIDRSFCNIQNIKNIRVPVSPYNTTEDILHLQTNIDKIISFLRSNMHDHNILLFGYENYTIPSIIIGVYMKKVGELPTHTIKDIILSKNNNVQIEHDFSIF